jgi:hypothetical protein
MRPVYALVVVIAVSVGCHTSKKLDTRAPHVEEYTLPPDEVRYNTPPEDKYRKRDGIKDLARPGAGQMIPDGGPAGMPGGGFNQPGTGGMSGVR